MNYKIVLLQTNHILFMQLSGQLFRGSTTDEVMQLTERSAHNSVAIIAALGVCLLLISVARLRQREVFLILGQSTFFFQSITERYKNGIRENPMTSLFLILQYFIICAICIYWYNHFSLADFSTYQTSILIAFPVILFLYQFIIISLTGTITGFKEIIQEMNQLTFTLAQSAGIVILIEFIFIYFQPQFVLESKLIIGGTFLFFLVLRIIRGFYHAFQLGVSWYYIILYLWTLEILPLLIVIKLVFNDEISSWLW
ncbi:DUF4271 domain-containing protein [Fluviicola taffensis]|uniref:DUF4271 domain-containing protein n=1 Tax=Fluviicola taffensis (strain DSM 16823 / NCIMB 13979 / RW262) TaxID=755732 RepID=F2ICW6_FLUTR|nr:DUF4271 domain-containing protein [Fluviicola taffensis]AEA43340.1 hypothetical protein Fluta_1345 [Fluviicola taffensis DSM 16823]